MQKYFSQNVRAQGKFRDDPEPILPPPLRGLCAQEPGIVARRAASGGCWKQRSGSSPPRSGVRV